MQLRNSLGSRWPAIAGADARARDTRLALQQALQGLDSEDSSIVVFGSLARGEFTAGSDLDWTLLIDGRADPQDLQDFQAIAERVKEVVHKEPGREGLFKGITFSHGILHHIGGEEDTNRNITQRILLLLESEPIGRREAYDRVVKNVLRRYIQEDDGLWHGSKPHRIPRFLLNDIVRYWRTVCVDFAYKQRERAGEEFAIRNAKLRMSRKLIFASGLLMCFGSHLYLPPGTREEIFDQQDHAPLIEHLLAFVEATPLEILAYELLHSNHPAARPIFEAYDRFLAMLADDPTREHLEKLNRNQLRTDATFRQVREIGRGFEEGLQQIFFGPRLEDLTKRYGVF